MKRSIVFIVAGVLLTAAQASAQEQPAGPGTIEVSVIPGGGTFFTSHDGAPSFGNYTLGGALTYNFNRIVGVEGEVGGSLGISQNLTFGGVAVDRKTPNLLNYAGNVVVHAPTRASVVPYITGGIGGLTVFDRASLGINATQTFLTGNVGGGVKWYANSRVGLRADYRFIALQGTDDAPAFFGTDTRYGHRISAGVVINAVR